MPRGTVKIPIPSPYGGLRRDLVPWQQPIETMVDGSNVVIRDRKLYVRSGYRKLDATGFGERVMGGIFWKTVTGAERTVAAGTASRKHFTAGAWADITGTAWTGDETNQARFVEFPSGETIYIVGVNGKDGTVVWDGIAATDSDLGGGAPIAKDITAVSNRVIYGNVIVGANAYPHAFMFSAFNDHTSTPATNIISVAEASGPIVAVRNLGIQSIAIYTEKAQIVSTLQGGAVPFRVDYRSGQPGPGSASAVVNAGGETHFYMGRDGNFYRFDGGRCTPIGNAVKTAVQASINTEHLNRSHGVFDRQNREVHWFWPTRGVADIKGGITYNIDADIWSPIHTFANSISASLEWDDLSDLAWTDLTGTWAALGGTYPTWLSMGSASRAAQLLGEADGQSYIFGGESDDDGNAIDAYWIYPSKPLAGDGKIARVDCFEPYYKQLGASMNLDVYLGRANFPGGAITYEAVQTFDMSASDLPEAKYVDVNGRTIAIKCRVTEANQGMEFLGGVLYLYERGVPA